MTNFNLHSYLKQWPQVLSHFNKIILKLKLKQIKGSYPCAATTLDLVRSVLGTCRFQHAEHMITVVRAIGKELSFYAPSEFTIGNMIRRILYVIRDEYANKLREVMNKGTLSLESQPNSTSNNYNTTTRERSESHVSQSSEVFDRLEKLLIENSDTFEINSDDSNNNNDDDDDDDDNNNNNDNEGDSNRNLTQQSKNNRQHHRHGKASPSGAAQSFYEHTLQPTLGSVLGRATSAPDDYNVTSTTSSPFPTELTQPIDIRQGIMSTIQEISTEMENSIPAIASYVSDFIHSGECILVIGQSYTIQNFIALAAKKIRFNVIIATEGQNMVGHSMATTLSSLNNISVTLIPDYAVYSIMSKVHKVLFSPQALMADGGVICFAGHLMILLAAKERSIPVVGIAGLHKLTPLYSHNQNNILQLMSSPSNLLPDDAPLLTDHIEVHIPLYDYIPSDLIQLYITNNGSHQPSYIYRLLNEFFHPSDYNY